MRAVNDSTVRCVLVSTYNVSNKDDNGGSGVEGFERERERLSSIVPISVSHS